MWPRVIVSGARLRILSQIGMQSKFFVRFEFGVLLGIIAKISYNSQLVDSCGTPVNNAKKNFMNTICYTIQSITSDET